MEDFDPDAYLAESSSADFDPDQYLAETRDVGKMESFGRGAAQGASLGFADEISGAGNALWDDLKSIVSGENGAESYTKHRDDSRANYKRAEEANPNSYGIGEFSGGLATALVPVGSAANVGRAAIMGAGLGGATGVGKSEGESIEDVTIDGLKGAAFGGALGAGGYAAGKGLSKLANKASEKFSKPLAEMLPIGKKANAPDIEEAANALGFKATPGMTSASGTVQKLESSLHQSPTIGGYLTRRTTGPANEGMAKMTGELVEDAATISPYESGEAAKKILASDVAKKFKPSIDTFNDLKQYTKDIPTSERSIKAVSKNIMAIPEVEVLDLPLARQVVKSLEKNPSVDQIKTLRSMVGKKASSSLDKAEASAYWQIYAKLGKLEENSLKRGVIASARNADEGGTIAEGMLGQLKGAKKGYSEQIGNLQGFAKDARLGNIKTPSDFVSKMDAVPSEKLQEKLLPLEDVRLAQSLEKNFPDAYRGLKSARVRDMAEGVEIDGQFLPGKLLQRTKGLNPEAQAMLFGDKSQGLNNLRTAYQSLPDKVGPSGTQQAFDVAGMLNPINQVRDLARFGTYKVASSDSLAKLAEHLKTMPKFANMAEKNPKAFQAAVYDLSKRLHPEKVFSEVAGENDSPDFVSNQIPDKQNQRAFIEGN